MKKRVVTMLLILLVLSPHFAHVQADERQVFAYYANGIAQFMEDGYLGLVNAEGEVILPAKYKSISPRYHEGLAIARSESDTAYINENGSIVIELPNVRASSFTNGYAWAYGTIDHITGTFLVDKTGKVVRIPTDIIYIEDVHDGMVFCVRRIEENPTGRYIECYINTNGDLAFDLPNVYEEYIEGRESWFPDESFNNGFAILYYQDCVYLINKQGDIVSELPVLPYYLNFSFGPLSVACDPETRLYGFMNMKGEYIVPPIAQAERDIYPMVEERGLLRAGKGLWRCYDEAGQLLFEIQCDAISPFYQGYAVVRTITKTSEFVEYDENNQPQNPAWAFSEDSLWFSSGRGYNVTTTSVTTDVIDRDGNVVINDSTAIVWREGRDDYMPMSDGLIAFEEDGKYGFMDIHGETVITPQFEELDFSGGIEGYDYMATHFVEGYAWVKKDGHWWLIDTKGEIVSPGS